MTTPHDPLHSNNQWQVVISPKEIYDAVMRMTGKMDALIVQHDEQKSRIQDMESRLRLLERSRWPLPAVAILISVAAIVIKFIPT